MWTPLPLSWPLMPGLELRECSYQFREKGLCIFWKQILPRGHRCISEEINAWPPAVSWRIKATAASFWRSRSALSFPIPAERISYYMTLWKTRSPSTACGAQKPVISHRECLSKMQTVSHSRMDEYSCKVLSSYEACSYRSQFAALVLDQDFHEICWVSYRALRIL